MSTGRLAAKIARRREKSFTINQCRSKWRHETILTAIIHAREVAEREQIPFCFYECSDCGWIHVGRLGLSESVFMYGGWAENVRELQGFTK